MVPHLFHIAKENSISTGVIFKIIFNSVKLHRWILLEQSRKRVATACCSKNKYGRTERTGKRSQIIFPNATFGSYGGGVGPEYFSSLVVDHSFSAN